jgi:hypothetical protein
MSRTFSSGSDNLKATSATAYVTPFTVSVWYKRVGASTASQRLFQAGTGVSGNNFFALFDSGSAVNRVSNATVNDSGTSTTVTTSSFYSDSNWHFQTAVFASATSRSIYLDAGFKVSDNVTNRVPTGTMDTLRVSGALTGSAPILDGNKVAYIGVWDIALSDAEVAQLAANAPSQVRSDHLVEYWPLTGNLSPEPSYGSRATSLTVAGTVYDTDNPTLYLGTNPPVRRKFRIYNTTYYPR